MKKLFTLLFTVLCSVFAFAGDGTKANPYTVTEAMSQVGKIGYVKGYIIGTVKPGEDNNTVTSVDQLIFEGPFSTAVARPSVLVMADSKTERDLAKIFFVALPSQSDLRSQANIVDNPDNLGKWLNVSGSIGNASFGTNYGIKFPTGVTPDFVLEGGGGTVTWVYQESFATSQGSFTVDNVSGAQTWEWRNYQTNPGYMYMSGHDGTNNVANEDLLISPAYDFSKLSDGAFVTFKHAIKFATPAEMAVNQTLWIKDSEGNEDQLIIQKYPAGTDWTFVNAGNMIIPSKYIGKTAVNIIFKYVSTSASGGAWEVNDFGIANSSTIGVAGKEEISLSVYPNPAVDVINVNLGNVKGDINVFDLVGKNVYSVSGVTGLNSVNVADFNRGIYLIKVSSGKSVSVKKVVVK